MLKNPHLLSLDHRHHAADGMLVNFLKHQHTGPSSIVGQVTGLHDHRQINIQLGGNNLRYDGVHAVEQHAAGGRAPTGNEDFAGIKKLDQVGHGHTQHAARISISPVTEFVPALEAFGLPYIWASREHMWKVLNGATGQHLLKEVENYKF